MSKNIIKVVSKKDHRNREVYYKKSKKDYTYVLDAFLHKFSKNFIFVDFEYGYGGNTLSRIIAASPEFYWDGDPVLYPDKGYSIIEDPEPSPHFASPIE